MPPQIAALACVAFILLLFWIDRKSPDGVSRAVWIPLIWMFFAGSRFASQWLSLGVPGSYSNFSYDEGSPLDRNVFLILIVAAAWVLKQREFDWGGLMRCNVWLVLFFAFAALSTLWADDPFVALKRWVKLLGTLFMALLIATERRPDEALGFILRRLAYVLAPLSILFIKYYPEIGRGYHMGEPMFTGVALQKNTLGQLCLYLGIYVAWALLYKRNAGANRIGNELATPLLLVTPMLAWVLYLSDSATSIATTALAIGFMVALKFEFFRRSHQRILTVTAISGLLMAILLATTNIANTVITWMGRDPDLTNRLPIWSMLLGKVSNPIIGSGYESFWYGDRMTEIWAAMGTEGGGILQAHNGYIDLYLNLGWVGLSLLFMAVLTGLRSVRARFYLDYADATLRLTFVLVLLIYNYTEAAFKPVHNLFLLMLFGIYPIRMATRRLAPLRHTRAATGNQTGGADSRARRLSGQRENKVRSGA